MKKDWMIKESELDDDQIKVLMATLDNKYPISTELARLYDFFKYQLVEANIKKDKAILEEVNMHLRSMRDNWKEVMRVNKEKK